MGTVKKLRKQQKGIINLKRLTKVLATLYVLGSVSATGYLYSTVNEVKKDRDAISQNREVIKQDWTKEIELNQELTSANNSLKESNAGLQDSLNKTNTELDKLKEKISELEGNLEQKQKENEDLQTQVALKKQKQAEQAKAEQKAQEQKAQESKAETPKVTQVAQKQESAPQGRTLIMESTAYSSDPADTLGGGTITATGQNLLANPMAVAVDPNVIPLGTKLHVEGYGTAYAVDTGGAIKGNIIDVHFPTYSQCINWGRRQVTVTILS